MELGKPGRNITRSTAWKAICSELGRTGETAPFDGKRSSWENIVRDQYLSKGYGVMLCGFGHVVRIQSVTDTGVVVDDPFGKSAGPRKAWSETNSRKEESKAGDNSEWVWPNEKAGMAIFYVK